MRNLLTVFGLSFLLIACGDRTEPPITEDNDVIEDVVLDPAPADPLSWLEEVEGEAALTWVKAQNARTLEALKGDSRFQRNYNNALAALTSETRIPYGRIRNGYVYNFWQDDTNPKGLWRRTSLKNYRDEKPQWDVILDIDALAKTEGKNWVFKGVDCYSVPNINAKTNKDSENENTLTSGRLYRCMVRLSDGGKDAVIAREFDMNSRDFVIDGFVTRESRQGLEWLDQNTLLIATDWTGDGTSLTDSQYPVEVRRWKRGTPLDTAELVYEGEKKDVAIWPMIAELPNNVRRPGVVQSRTFYEHDYLFELDDGALTPFDIPSRSSLIGLYKGRMLVILKEDWDFDENNAFELGDLISIDFMKFLEHGGISVPEIVFRPNDRQAIEDVHITKNGIIMAINDNVVGKVLRLERRQYGWSAIPIALPGQGQASIVFSDKNETIAFLGYEGFLSPETVLEFDSVSHAVAPIKTLPEKFLTDDLTVMQNFATSSDGTQIPYFLIHRKDLVYNGQTPTILYGYGGFEVSIQPSYSEIRGKLWLEQGGAYVIANIRGGGEFGPNWHQAGLKTNRQKIFDDFIAVAEDLIDRRISSPEKMGIIGRSNGGLLMGVMLTQRPDLFKAVDIGVPLLDMLRYHKLLAGASWVGEYGSPEISEEAAFLRSISPYHNFDADAEYPIPFFYTSTKDDRVHPGHARKMAKLFEDAGKAFYYFENIDGGHAGAAKPETMALRIALEYTYFANQLMPQP